jgi:PTS system N-acetylglucosamine-specific IIC component
MQFGQLVANPENPAVAIPGTAVYAILNRLLLPFGLHQILNTFF